MTSVFLRHGEGIPLEDWLVSNRPTTDTAGKISFRDKIDFVQGPLAGLFYSTVEEQKRTSVTVVGSHHSRSLVLPVFSIWTPRLEVRLRNNLFNWAVSVRASSPVQNHFHGLVDTSTRHSLNDFEGFSRDWVFGPYKDDPTRFSFHVLTDLQLYALFLVVMDNLEVQRAERLVRRGPFE